MNALLPNACQFAANSMEADISRSMLLGDAMGLLFAPYHATSTEGKHDDPAQWLNIASFESCQSCAEGLHVLPWYAQSRDRQQLASHALKVLIGPQSRLEGDISLTRALLDVECSQICSHQGQIDAVSAAGKHGYASAKRWLASYSGSPQVWCAFAALETRRGRSSQALKV